MNHPKLRFGLGALGALAAWAAYAVILFRGLPLVMLYANEFGSSCATGRLEAQSSLSELVPVVLLSGGVGWGMARASKCFVRTARLGFIGSALTSVFSIAAVNALSR